MNKLITSFETKQKSLNFQQERKLLEEIKEGIEVIKSESSSPEVKKKAVHEVYFDLTHQFSPKEIRKRENREPTKRENEKWNKIQTTYQKLANSFRTLLHYNYNFVKYIERGYYYYGMLEKEDLTAEGTISLLKAAEKFDLSSKNCFSTYSGIWIKQYIQTLINESYLLRQNPTTTKEKKK